MNRLHIFLGILILSLIGLVGCAQPAPTPVPTRTSAPTFTPSPIVQPAVVNPDELATAKAIEALATVQAAQQAAQNQPAQNPQQNPPPENPPQGNPPPDAPAPDTAQQPAQEEAPPPTNTPIPPTAVPQPEVVINSPINIRQGPGTNYSIIGSAQIGQRFPVTGRSNDNSWWQINFNGLNGWVFGQLVTPVSTGSVAVAANIPPPPQPTAIPPTPTFTYAPPPPTPTFTYAPPTQPPPPPPTAIPPTAVPPTNTPSAPPTPAPPPEPSYRYTLIDQFVKCDPNAGNTYFKGVIRNGRNELKNAVCIHIHFYEPRKTKCSGCDGVGDGNWGFSPFGGPAPPGTPVEIFIVECPGPIPHGGLNNNFGDLTPLSKKWTYTVGQSTQCVDITFAGF
ncbi:MAG: SH3 domain-containing protein [Chloroflexota bacterium]